MHSGALTLPGTEITFESSTNAPAVNAPASNLPHEVAPVFMVMLAPAKIFPWNTEFVPSVAELAACHHTLEALAPLISKMRAEVAVPVLLEDWKTKVAFGLP